MGFVLAAAFCLLLSTLMLAIHLMRQRRNEQKANVFFVGLKCNQFVVYMKTCSCKHERGKPFIM